MSPFQISFAVLIVNTAMLIFSSGAHGQVGEFVEGCGELRLTGAEQCLTFFPDSGEFPYGILRSGGWGDFQEGDRIHAVGLLELCGGFCDTGLCLPTDSVIEVCPPIPAVSAWGMTALALSILAAAVIVIRTGKRRRHTLGIVGVFLVVAVCVPGLAQDARKPLEIRFFYPPP